MTKIIEWLNQLNGYYNQDYVDVTFVHTSWKLWVYIRHSSVTIYWKFIPKWKFIPLKRGMPWREYDEKFSLQTVIDDEVRLTCPIKLIVAPSRLLATVKRGQIVVNRDQIAAQSRHFKLASFISRLCINLKFQNWIKSFKIGSKFNFRISFRFLQNQNFFYLNLTKIEIRISVSKITLLNIR